MTHSIFIDPDRKAALLVNDDPVYALGPVMVADEVAEARELIEAFVSALESPPEQMPTIGLMTEWEGFLMAFHGMVGTAPEADPPGAEGDSGDDVGQAPIEAPAPLTAAEDGPGADGAADFNAPAGEISVVPDAGPRPIPDDDEEDDDDEEELSAGELRGRLHQVPGGTPAQREQAECWACGGIGHISIGKEQQQCNVCNGTGRIPADQPA